MLSVKNIDVYYGNVQAIYNASITVENNEIISIIGSNGAGKTTLMKTIMGINKHKSGEIKFLGDNINKLTTHEIVKRGVVYVPEGRGLFSKMTVIENLEMGAYTKHYSKQVYDEKIDEIFNIFPKLKERYKQLAGSLSGGEQQMVAIARGLMCEPKLLMLDEPSLGLAPVIFDEMFDNIVNINKTKNIPIILVEQNAYMALKISCRGYVLGNGHIKFEGKSEDLINSPEIKKAYLGD